MGEVNWSWMRDPIGCEADQLCTLSEWTGLFKLSLVRDRWWWGNDGVTPFSVADQNFLVKLDSSNDGVKKVLRVIIFFTIWNLWKAKNASIFRGKKMSSKEMFEEVISLAFLWVKFRGRNGVSLNSGIIDNDVHKANFCSLWGFGYAGCGMVLSKSRKRPLAMVAARFSGGLGMIGLSLGFDLGLDSWGEDPLRQLGFLCLVFVDSKYLSIPLCFSWNLVMLRSINTTRPFVG
ncbi:hypothetical protein E3N88_00585 [Mikania micrantha]|uniref:Reverse transcriptase zinc-binding domain-containing protein n=1 Tax=Mikania micrantha TaxID=192012 RepID=A0A5N6PYJ5_9ASTR|nr:hypothetical protein E3N88_00585 [Mikania micrantha]